MSEIRSTHAFTVRSYEIGPSQRVERGGHFLRWFQEAAYANSEWLDYDLDRYREMGVFWVLHEIDLQLVARPAFNERVDVTTWIAEMQRIKAWRQYEARDAAGRPLARCNATWVMIDPQSQRATRIPEIMFEEFTPNHEYILTARDWSPVDGDVHTFELPVGYFDEDEMAHVNHAVYLDWIEESARRAALAAHIAPPRFTRHRLRYHNAAFRGDRLRIDSAFAPINGEQHWQHTVWRGYTRLVSANGVSTENGTAT